jgi:hypothetical protein
MWLALVPCALAGELFVNGQVVDPRELADVKLERATIWFDTSGAIHVDAPGYNIEVLTPVVTQASRPAPSTSDVTPARWWLVTEDSGTAGHTIEIRINGQLVQTVRSGDAQRILDVARWLHVGTNEVEIRSNSVQAAGGSLYVYVGTGSDRSGTVVMDEPVVQFGVGSDRSGPYSRTYTLNVDR